MNKKNSYPNTPKQFSAVLTPYRSLSPRGFVILMALIGLVSFGAGFAFFLIGAWPVMVFFGLDVLLIYVVFKLNYRSGQLYETVDLTDSELKITRVYPSGQSKCWCFNPYWVRLEFVNRPGKNAIMYLTSHGRKLIFGTFLTDEEKKDFAEALSGALSAHRTETNG